MNAIRLPSGNLMVPRRAESEDGILGDGMVEISPDHPDYATWEAEAISPEEARRANLCLLGAS